MVVFLFLFFTFWDFQHKVPQGRQNSAGKLGQLPLFCRDLLWCTWPLFDRPLSWLEMKIMGTWSSFLVMTSVCFYQILFCIMWYGLWILPQTVLCLSCWIWGIFPQGRISSLWESTKDPSHLVFSPTSRVSRNHRNSAECLGPLTYLLLSNCCGFHSKIPFLKS